MFAYCRNNPVSRKDISGTEDICVTDGDDENPMNDLGYSSGGGSAGGGNSSTGNGGACGGPMGSGHAGSNAKGSHTIPHTSKNQTAPGNKTQDTFLPDSFYSKNAPKQSTPNSSRIHYKYNTKTGKLEKSTVYYDHAGRQTIRIDWTNHGYSIHGNPHVHITTYDSRYRDGITTRWD